MGMFDYVSVYMECPFCHNFVGFDAQTKDLDCVMFNYRTLPDDWFTNKLERKFRKDLPVFAKFPLDKEAAVWKDQAERQEAEATIFPEFADQLKYVTVVADCPKCGKYFDGKIRIQDGKLMGEIYEVVEWEPKNSLTKE